MNLVKTTIAVCAVILFASLMIQKIEINIEHHHKMSGEMTLKHDLGGNLHSPITLKLQDPGWPIKVDVNHKGNK